jgi:anhydro-N-acetylmuramic acid kinase
MSQGQKFLSIGTMSGTSMDGIDVALIETDGLDDIREIDNIAFDYDWEFKLVLKALEYSVRRHLGEIAMLQKTSVQDFLKDYLQKILSMDEKKTEENIEKITQYLKKKGLVILDLQQVIQLLTEFHYQAVQRLVEKIKPKKLKIDIIGFHGQTLYHQPHRQMTLQVGDGALLAKRLGISVVNDFRSRDVSLGGQGAPFAPIYHQALAMRDNLYPLGVINCGGIANVSLIQGKGAANLLGFDTGPGNGLIDLFVKRHTDFKEVMDSDGKYGLQGKVNAKVLAALYEKAIFINHQNYFKQPPPKSLDINDLMLIPELPMLSFADACRTLEAFTADSIVLGIERFNKVIPNLLVLAGGGWYNPVIKQEFETRVHQRLGDQIQVKTVDEIGWNSKAMEAQIFAYLAVRHVLNEPISFPETTGVSKPLCGGQLFRMFYRN